MRKILLSTEFLTAGIPVIGGLVFLLGSGILSHIYHGHIPNLLFVMLFEISNLFILTGCFMMIKRREASRFGRPSIKGPIAVVSGTIGLIVWAGIGVALAYMYLVK